MVEVKLVVSVTSSGTQDCLCWFLVIFRNWRQWSVENKVE